MRHAAAWQTERHVRNRREHSNGVRESNKNNTKHAYVTIINLRWGRAIGLVGMVPKRDPKETLRRPLADGDPDCRSSFPALSASHSHCRVATLAVIIRRWCASCECSSSHFFALSDPLFSLAASLRLSFLRSASRPPPISPRRSSQPPPPLAPQPLSNTLTSSLLSPP